jgi:hypothetical protein
MNLTRLPGSRRTPSGLEWTVLKRMPVILLVGTLVPAAVVFMMQAGLVELSAKDALEAQYTAFGVVLFHWISMFTLGIFCLIVVLMKGHAYVADAYPLSDSEHPKQ